MGWGKPNSAFRHHRLYVLLFTLLSIATFALWAPVAHAGSTAGTFEIDGNPANSLQDLTASDSANLVGPGPLSKYVRNVSTGGTFAPTATAAPGQTLEYQLVYSVSGADAHNVTISDQIPGRTTFNNTCSNVCAFNSGTDTVSWNIGTVPDGTTVSETFQVTLDPVFPNGMTTVSNTGSYTNTEEGGPHFSNSADTTVNAAPVNNLAKAARDVSAGTTMFTTNTDASPGDTIDYRLSYQNTGSANATNVVLTDPLPAHTSFVAGGGCSQTCTISGAGLGSIVRFSLGTVAPSTTPTIVIFRVTLEPSFASGMIVNTGLVSSTEEPDGKDSNGSTVNVLAPSSSLLKSAKDTSTTGVAGANITGNPGDTIVYTLSYTNSGNGDAHNVVVTDPVPARTTYQSCTGGTSCSQAGGTVTWNLGTVTANGGTATLTFTVKLDAVFPNGGTTVSNTAHVTTSEEPGGKDSGGTTVMVTAAPTSDLSKSAKDERTGQTGTNIAAQPGDTITYTLSYQNTGNANATNVTISDPIPGRTTFVAGSCTPACTTTGSPVSSVAFNLGTVAPSTTPTTVTFQVELDPTFPTGPTPVTNVGSLTTTEEPGTTETTTVTVTVTATPNLAVVKSDSHAATSPTAGDTITYTLAYSNTGNGNASNTTITENIPSGTTYSSCGPTLPGCTTTGSPVTKVTWSLGAVNGGSRGSVTLTVTVNGSATCTVVNTAQIASPDQNDGTPVNSNQDTVNTTPAPNPAGAHASGNATGANIHAPLLLKNDVTLAPTSSTQTGVGSNSNNASGLGLLIPTSGASKGSLLNAGVPQTTSRSTVTANPAIAENITTAETASLKAVNIAGVPLVAADAVRSVADATATGTDAHYSAAGSAFTNLRVAGLAVTHIYANERIIIPNLLGVSGYVIVDEVTGSTTTPATGVKSGGTYSSDVTVNALHIHIDPGLLLGNQPIDIVVSHAVAHADFPQTTLCTASPT